MPYLFLVLLKINLVLILFALTYYLVLRKLTFYILNRIFLLFGLVFSTAYPFINLTEIFNNHDALPAFVPGLNQNVSQLVQLNSVSYLWQILTAVFYCGVIFMMLRLFIQFISLYQIHKKSSPGLVNDLKVRMLTDKISPFSFWQNIYVNPNLHKPKDLNNIIEHEKIHVEELHTLDIVLAEISLVFYWFNPGVWLMKKAVKENIEFITDAKILKKGVDRKAYQYSLLDVGILQHPVSIINNFNLFDLKKRIRMMNVKRSSKINLTRYVFVLPIILCVSLAFTIDKKDIETQISSVKNLFPNTEQNNQPVELAKSVAKKNTVRKIKSKAKLKIDSVLSFVNVLSVPSIADTIKLTKNTDKKVEFLMVKREPRAKPTFNTIYSGVFLKNNSASENNEDKDKEVVVIGYARKPAGQAPIVRVRGMKIDSLNTGEPSRFIINGEVITKDKLSSIDPNTIKTITVIAKPTAQ
ncbi:M56 family metallopeptidase [Pedobacter aquatilis]|uniref:M56 family metallopeptidase n=1 Tax=Pedobacter aquatilis TaxID=351343 RepID=UPI00292CE8BB|nr:M56 family metallopeptidase [Pedobacter aquatilis]